MVYRSFFIAFLSFSILLGCSENNKAQALQTDETQKKQTPQKQKLKPNQKQGSTAVKKAIASNGFTKIPDVVDKVLPSVVQITATKTVERQIPPFMHPFLRRRMEPEQFKRRGLGSGVIVDKNGTIITNSHVVENADEIKVKFSDGSEKEAKVIGSDKKSEVAVVKLTNPPSDLKPIEFGDSDKARLGEPVIAIGSPFGLSSTVTLGIVSATGRADVGIADYENFIQTDAAINPGNSGGALVNTEGKLIGINTAIASKSGGYQGIGFAIPSNMAKDIMQSLIEHGKVVRGWLGVMIQTLQPEMAPSFKVKADTQGVLISQVNEGSPADEAGLQRGDIVIKAQGQKIETSSKLRNLVATEDPGSKLKLTILRNGSKKKVTVKLGKRPGEDGQTRTQPGSGDEILEGLALAPLNSRARQQFDIPQGLKQGVLVADIERGSPAAETGLRPGDIILEVNRKSVSSVDDFQKRYQAAKNRVILLVQREDATLYLAFQK